MESLFTQEFNIWLRQRQGKRKLRIRQLSEIVDLRWMSPLSESDPFNLMRLPQQGLSQIEPGQKFQRPGPQHVGFAVPSGTLAMIDDPRANTGVCELMGDEEPYRPRPDDQHIGIVHACHHIP
ncbi:hypothetical protein M2390_000770 [Mycetocola sp. BIGb0189]|nr:hypothetical protein [Mycetocola sp. BIGb0189]